MWLSGNLCAISSIAIILVALHSGVKCVKVRDRFDMKRLAETRLRVLMPEVRRVVTQFND